MTDTCENDYGKDADTQKEKQDICPDHIFGELFLCDMYPNDNIWPRNYRHLLRLCDLASGVPSTTVLSLHEQCVRIICQYLYDNGHSSSVCGDLGDSVVLNTLPLPNKLKCEIAKEMDRNVMFHIEKYVEPALQSLP